MPKTTIQQLNEFGQSVWLDNISRVMIENGKLHERITQGLVGMTSNPTIFDKAISSGADYDEQIKVLCKTCHSTFEIYDELTVQDIQDAASVFKSIHEQSKGLDGYVSLEVNPNLAYDTSQSIEEAKRLHKKVNRANVMFKIPATNEGFTAAEELLAAGININMTLIFSLEQYINTTKAYLRAMARRIENNADVSPIRSVASVFVSRIDTVVDKLLDEKIAKESNEEVIQKLQSLKGKAAVANSVLIYKKYLEVFSSPEFKELQRKGAHLQRVLWGSTSTKNPSYSDTKYVTELIAKDSVNTMPESTFSAFLDHGKVQEAVTVNFQTAESIIKQLNSIGIDIGEVCNKLLTDGVAAFENSFNSLLSTIEAKQKTLCPAC